MKLRSVLRVSVMALAGLFTMQVSAGVNEHEVKIETSDPAVVLAGTLLVPGAADGGTVILLITGSGDHPRDQVISGTPMFRVIAESLAEAGVATLRLDDRGTAKSTGPSTAESTTGDRAEDMRAAMRWLREGTLKSFTRVGIMGHSEGAGIGAWLAAGDDAPDFLITVGAPALSGTEVWVDQQLAAFRQGVGIDDTATLAEVERHLRKATELSVSGASAEAMRENTIALFALGNIDVTTEENGPMLEGFTARMADKWMRYFLGDDPGKAFAKTRVPLLAIYGSHDQLTSAAKNAPALLDALIAAGNTDFTLRVMPDQDHFFMRAPGKPVGQHVFGQMEVSSELVQESVSWLKQRNAL